MKKQFFILLICLMCLALPVAAQKNVSGTWSWESKPDKKKVQNMFWIDIKQNGSKVKGGISVFFYDTNGEDGSDSPITPFIGTVTGNVVNIEFDAEDTSALDGSPLPKYVRRKNGAPNTATVKLLNGKLEFTQTKGSIGKEYPRKFMLTKSK